MDVHVLLAGDKGIVPGLFVTIASLADNCTSSRNLIIHFMDVGVSTSDRQALQAMVKSMNNVSLEIHDVDLNVFKGANSYRGSFGAYARLLVQRYVKAPRVIYVDTDFLFLRDPAELYDWDMQGKIVWATSTPMIPRLADDCPFLSAEEIAGEPYFNSGILLIDLEKWRKNQCEERIMALLRQPIVLGHHDQTLLNYVLRGEWGELDASWGLLQLHDTENPSKTNFHFGGGGVKPWQWGCHYGSAPIWWAYYDTYVRPYYRFAGDERIKAHTFRLLQSAHLIARGVPAPMLGLIFGREKAKRMKIRDRCYGVMKRTAECVRKGRV